MIDHSGTITCQEHTSRDVRLLPNMSLQVYVMMWMALSLGSSSGFSKGLGRIEQEDLRCEVGIR